MQWRFRLDVVARQLVEQWKLTAGDSIVAVEPRGAARDARCVVRLAEGAPVGLRPAWRGEGYRVFYMYNATIAAARGALPPDAQGAAILDDGSYFFLSDAGDLRAFYRRLRGHVAPLDLARIVVRFHGHAGERILDGRAPGAPKVAARGRGFIALPVVRAAPPRIDFCTVVPRLGAGAARIDRWRVEERGGELGWSRRAIVP